MHVMRRTPLLAFLTALAAVLAAPPAFAAFNVCNKSDTATRVALGRFDGTRWTSQGWWTIAPKTCTHLLNGPLQARYYYLYATDGAGGTWEGKTRFCTTPGTKFLAAGRNDCTSRGFDQRGFFEVDTGKSPEWTQTLSN
ncbi:MAG: DUF1036 domain-containing protein [Rhizomicrobium sp.]|jgi:uncharacterized membrane protein